MVLVKPGKAKQEPSINIGSNVPAQNRIVAEKSLEARTYCNYWLAIAFVLIAVFRNFYNRSATQALIFNEDE